MASREKEIREVAEKLDGLLNDLQAAVDGLTAILTSPPKPGKPDGKEVPA